MPFDLRMITRSIPSHDISKMRRMILHLRGESAGVREVVITNLVGDFPCNYAAPLGLGISGWLWAINMSRLRRWLKAPEGWRSPRLLRAVCEALAIAERLDCGDFSTAFRPHEDYPSFQVLRPHESAA